jgi:hypothetical protein
MLWGKFWITSLHRIEKNMNTRTLATILGTALSATTIALQANPASAQTAFGYASYSVRHDFNFNFGGNAPNLLRAIAHVS